MSEKTILALCEANIGVSALHGGQSHVKRIHKSKQGSEDVKNGAKQVNKNASQHCIAVPIATKST